MFDPIFESIFDPVFLIMKRIHFFILINFLVGIHCNPVQAAGPNFAPGSIGQGFAARIPVIFLKVLHQRFLVARDRYPMSHSHFDNFIYQPSKIKLTLAFTMKLR